MIKRIKECSLFFVDMALSLVVIASVMVAFPIIAILHIMYGNVITYEK